LESLSLLHLTSMASLLRVLSERPRSIRGYEEDESIVIKLGCVGPDERDGITKVTEAALIFRAHVDQRGLLQVVFQEGSVPDT